MCNNTRLFCYLLVMKLPKSWKDVSVQQLIELEAIKSDTALNNELAPDIVRGLLILSLFTGETYEKLESDLTLKQIKEYINSMAFLNTMPEGKIRKWFYCNGYIWKVNLDVSEITAGKYIDMYELTKDPSVTVQNSGKILSLFCQPYTLGLRRVKMKDMEKADSLIKLPLSTLYPMALFFCSLFNELTNAIQSYSVSEMQKVNQELRKEIEQIRATA